MSTAEATTYNTAAFSARGNEPFWAVDAAGGTAIYKTPDNPDFEVFFLDDAAATIADFSGEPPKTYAV